MPIVRDGGRGQFEQGIKLDQKICLGRERFERQAVRAALAAVEDEAKAAR